MRKSLGAKTMMYPMPVLMIATYNEDGSVDVMNAAWGGIETDNRIGMCLSDDHKTTKNILRTKEFTVSFGTESAVKACDYLGLVSGNKVKDKFEKSGLTSSKADKVNAPIINELPIAIECKLVAYDEETCHLVADIVNINVDDMYVKEDGKIDVEKVGIITYDSSNHKYIKLGNIVADAFKIGREIK